MMSEGAAAASGIINGTAVAAEASGAGVLPLAEVPANDATHEVPLGSFAQQPANPTTTRIIPQIGATTVSLPVGSNERAIIHPDDIKGTDGTLRVALQLWSARKGPVIYLSLIHI